MRCWMQRLVGFELEREKMWEGRKAKEEVLPVGEGKDGRPDPESYFARAST
jgi:hypothetical protein